MARPKSDVLGRPKKEGGFKTFTELKDAVIERCWQILRVEKADQNKALAWIEKERAAWVGRDDGNPDRILARHLLKMVDVTQPAGELRSWLRGVVATKNGISVGDYARLPRASVSVATEVVWALDSIGFLGRPDHVATDTELAALVLIHGGDISPRPSPMRAVRVDEVLIASAKIVHKSRAKHSRAQFVLRMRKEREAQWDAWTPEERARHVAEGGEDPRRKTSSHDRV